MQANTVSILTTLLEISINYTIKHARCACHEYKYFLVSWNGTAAANANVVANFI